MKHALATALVLACPAVLPGCLTKPHTIDVVPNTDLLIEIVIESQGPPQVDPPKHTKHGPPDFANNPWGVKPWK